MNSQTNNNFALYMTKKAFSLITFAFTYKNKIREYMTCSTGYEPGFFTGTIDLF